MSHVWAHKDILLSLKYRNWDPYNHTLPLPGILHLPTYVSSPPKNTLVPVKIQTFFFSAYFNAYYKTNQTQNYLIFKYISIFQCSIQRFLFQFF